MLLRGISSIICSSVAPSPPSHILTARFIVDRVLLIDSTIYGFDQSIFGFIFAGMTAPITLWMTDILKPSLKEYDGVIILNATQWVFF